MKGDVILKKSLVFLTIFVLIVISLAGCAGGYKKHTAVFGNEFKVRFSLPENWFYSLNESDKVIIVADNDEQDCSDNHLLFFISVFEDSESKSFDAFLDKYTSERVKSGVGVEIVFENDHIRLIKQTSQTISGTEFVSYCGIYYNSRGKFHCLFRPVNIEPDIDMFKKIMQSILISE